MPNIPLLGALKKVSFSDMAKSLFLSALEYEEYRSEYEVNGQYISDEFLLDYDFTLT